jgi:pentatricopeptide repeat protein
MFHSFPFSLLLIILGSYCFSENGDVDGAIRYFKKALKYNIGLTDAYYNLGLL